MAAASASAEAVSGKAVAAVAAKAAVGDIVGEGVGMELEPVAASPFICLYPLAFPRRPV